MARKGLPQLPTRPVRILFISSHTGWNAQKQGLNPLPVYAVRCFSRQCCCYCWVGLGVFVRNLGMSFDHTTLNFTVLW